MPTKVNNVAECDDDDDVAKETIITFADELLNLLTSPNSGFDIRMEALRNMNLLLEDCPDETSSSIKNDSNVKSIVRQLPKFLFTAGDFEMQMSLIESMVRLVKKSERPLYARKWFPQQQLAVKFLEIKDSCFDADCRTFLNYLNESAGRKRSVYSYAAVKAYLGYHKLVVPKGGNLSEFWVDFNSVSKCLTIYVDEENNDNDSMWETITINADDVDNYTIKEEGSYNLLQLNLKISVSDLFDKCNDSSQVAQILFDKSVDVTHALMIAFGTRSDKMNVPNAIINAFGTRSDKMNTSIGKASVSKMDIYVNKASKSSHGIKHPLPDLMSQMPDLIMSPTTQMMKPSKGLNKPSPKPQHVVRLDNSMQQHKVSIPLNPMMSPAREMLTKPAAKTPTSANGSGQSKEDKHDKDLPKTPKSKQAGTKRVKTPLRIIIPNDKSTSDTASDTDKETNGNKKGTTKGKKRKKTSVSIKASSDDEITFNIKDNTVQDEKVGVGDNPPGFDEQEDIAEGVTEEVGLCTKSADNEAESNAAEEDFPVAKSGCLVPIENDSDTIPDSLPISSGFNSQLSNADRSEVYTKKVYSAAVTPALSTVTEEESSRSKHTTPNNQENLDKREAADLNLSQESTTSSQSVKIILTSQTTKAKPRYNPSMCGHKKQTKPNKQTSRVLKPKVKKHKDIDEVILENESDPYEFQVEMRLRKSKTQKDICTEKEKSRSKVKKTKGGNRKDRSIKAKKSITEDKEDHYSFEVFNEESEDSQEELYKRQKDDEILVGSEEDEPISYDQFHRKNRKQKRESEEENDVEEYQEDSLNDFKEQSEEKNEMNKKGRRGQKRKFGEEVNTIKPVKGRQKEAKKNKRKAMEKENTNNIESDRMKQTTRNNRGRKRMTEIEIMRDAGTDNMEAEFQDRDLQEMHSMVGAMIMGKTKQPSKSVYKRNIQLMDCDEKFLQEGNGTRRAQRKKQNTGQQEVIDDVTPTEEFYEVEPAEINENITNLQEGHVEEGLEKWRKKMRKGDEEQQRKGDMFENIRNEKATGNKIANTSKTEMRNKIKRNEDIKKSTWKNKSKDSETKKKPMNKESETESPEELIVDSDTEEEEEDLHDNEEVNTPQDDELSVVGFTKMCQNLLTDVKRPKRDRKFVNYQERGSSVDDSPTVQSVTSLSTKTNEEASSDVTGAPLSMLRGNRENDAVSTVSRRSWLIEREKKQVSTYSKGHTNVWVQHSGRAAIYVSPWVSDSDKKGDGNRNKRGHISKSHARKCQKRLSSMENQFLEPITVDDNTSDINEQEETKRSRTQEREDELVREKEKRKTLRKCVAIETTPAHEKDRYDTSKKQTRAPRKIASQQSDTNEQGHLYFQDSEVELKSKSTMSSGTLDIEYPELLNFHFDFEEEFMGEEEEEEEEEPEMPKKLAVPEKSNSQCSTYKTPRVQRPIRATPKEVQDATIPTDASGPSKNPRPTKSALKRKYGQEIEDEDDDVEEEPEEEEDVAIYEMMEKQSSSFRNSLRTSSLLIPKKLFEFDSEPDNDSVEEKGQHKADEAIIAADVVMSSSSSTPIGGSDAEEIGQIQQILHFVGGTINKQIQAKQNQTKLLTGCAINTATKHVKSLWSYQQARFKEFEAIKNKILAEVASLEEDLETMKRVEQKSTNLMKQLQVKLTIQLNQNITDMRNLYQEFQEKSLKLECCLQKQLRNGFENIISQEMTELKNRLIGDAKHQELMQMKKSLTSFFTSV